MLGDMVASAFKQSRSKWINIFPHNPTQTDSLRFKKMPYGEMNTAFTKSKSDFKKKKDYYKAIFDSMKEEFQ